MNNPIKQLSLEYQLIWQLGREAFTFNRLTEARKSRQLKSEMKELAIAWEKAREELREFLSEEVFKELKKLSNN